MRIVVCAGLIILILLALIHVVPENLNQRERGEEPTFPIGQMIAIVTGGITGMAILAIIALDGGKSG